MPVFYAYQGIIMEEFAEPGNENIKAPAGKIVVSAPYGFQDLFPCQQAVAVPAEIADEFRFAVSELFNVSLAVELEQVHVEGAIADIENALRRGRFDDPGSFQENFNLQGQFFRQVTHELFYASER